MINNLGKNSSLIFIFLICSGQGLYGIELFFYSMFKFQKKQLQGDSFRFITDCTQLKFILHLTQIHYIPLTVLIRSTWSKSVVPEHIHTHPMEGQWKLWGGRGLKSQTKLEFLEGERSTQHGRQFPFGDHNFLNLMIWLLFSFTTASTV